MILTCICIQKLLVYPYRTNNWLYAKWRLTFISKENRTVRFGWELHCISKISRIKLGQSFYDTYKDVIFYARGKIVAHITSTFRSRTHTYPWPKKFLHSLVQSQRSSKYWDVGLFGECVKKILADIWIIPHVLIKYYYGLEPIKQRTTQLRSWMNWQLSCPVLNWLIFRSVKEAKYAFSSQLNLKRMHFEKDTASRKCVNLLVLSPF